MDDKGIKTIEDALDVVIPDWYKEFLRNIPDWIHRTDENGEEIYWSLIYSKPETIIKATKGAREFKEEDWENSFPQNLVCIGFTDSDFVIRSGEKKQNVYTFCPYLGDVHPEETMLLKDLVRQLRAEYERNKA